MLFACVPQPLWWHYNTARQSCGLTQAGGLDELVQHVVEGQSLELNIGVHWVQRRGQVRQAQLMLGPQQGDRQHGRGGAVAVEPQLSEACREAAGGVDSGQGEVQGRHHLGGEAPPIQLLDLHLYGRAATSFEEVNGFGQEFVFASVLIPSRVPQQHLQL